MRNHKQTLEKIKHTVTKTQPQDIIKKIRLATKPLANARFIKIKDTWYVLTPPHCESGELVRVIKKSSRHNPVVELHEELIAPHQVKQTDHQRCWSFTTLYREDPNKNTHTFRIGDRLIAFSTARLNVNNKPDK